jgi:hypothetical protein
MEMKLWLLVGLSFLLPFTIYGVMLLKQAISRRAVLSFGILLVFFAGLDVYFLQVLAGAAKATASQVDDAIFASELSVALYLLPALFAGVGINVISHVLISHLAEAEARFGQDNPEK